MQEFFAPIDNNNNKKTLMTNANDHIAACHYVINQGGSFQWKGYGLRLHVDKGSLQPSTEEYKINVRASLSGQFQLPGDSDLLSPVF